jgi:hypothetical protein
MLRTLTATTALASLAILGGCIADESAPNRIGFERPAISPVNARNAADADKRALEKPQRELPTGRTEFPGQSNAGVAMDQVLTLDDAATAPAREFAPKEKNKLAKLNDKKDKATPGRDIPVPGTDYVINKSWGQVYALPSYPHRDFAVSVATVQTGSVAGNPWYFNNLYARPDYQPKHPYGKWGSIGADALEIPYAVGEIFALPVLMLMECPYKQKSTAFVSRDPNYNGYLPVTTNLVPAPYLGTFQFESATQPSAKQADDKYPISTGMPPVPVLP